MQVDVKQIGAEEEEAYLSPKWGRWDLRVNGYLDLSPTSPEGQDGTSDVVSWGCGGGMA